MLKYAGPILSFVLLTASARLCLAVPVILEKGEGLDASAGGFSYECEALIVQDPFLAQVTQTAFPLRKEPGLMVKSKKFKLTSNTPEFELNPGAFREFLDLSDDSTHYLKTFSGSRFASGFTIKAYMKDLPADPSQGASSSNPMSITLYADMTYYSDATSKNGLLLSVERMDLAHPSEIGVIGHFNPLLNGRIGADLSYSVSCKKL